MNRTVSLMLPASTAAAVVILCVAFLGPTVSQASSNVSGSGPVNQIAETVKTSNSSDAMPANVKPDVDLSLVVSAPQAEQTPVLEAVVLEDPNIEALNEIIGTEEAERLAQRARTDADAAWIAAHPEAYEKFGRLQAKLLLLAADEPMSLSFVRHYPDKAGATQADWTAPALNVHSPSPSVPDTKFPHFYQWDQRWGYTDFSEDGFGFAACGPTSLAMVYQGLTGKNDISPYEMGQKALDEGHVVYDQGTANTLFTEMSGELGLSCWEVPVSSDNIREALEAGHPVIANVRPGYFSSEGHFFVLTGFDDAGNVVLNDPYSPERSSRTWDAGLIASESMALFVFSAA